MKFNFTVYFNVKVIEICYLKILENYVKSNGGFNLGKYKIICIKGKYFILCR